LEDLCISRPRSRLNWGIPIPFDKDFVTYVWFDALINYVSALGYPAGENFRKFWPAAQHVIAKDILKPHGIYWPCMLKSAGIDPYQHLNVHGYWNINEGKMSKSLGNVVRPLDLVDVYGLDPFRYFLLREMVFGLDSEFSEEALVGRINADLANDLGNLVSRSVTMVDKYFDGELPAPGAPLQEDEELKERALQLIVTYETFMQRLGFHKALMAIWEVIGILNKYIDTMAPWVLAKSKGERLATVMSYIVETLKIVSVLIWPVMPASAEKIQRQLGMVRTGGDLRLGHVRQWGGEPSVEPVRKAPAVFPRVEVQPDPEGSKGKKGRKKAEREMGVQGKGQISLAEFQKLDIRVGTVTRAETVPGSKKLIQLVVDVGEERRLVAGLMGHYTEEELTGRQVVVLVNLEPVKLMGIESRGMVLAVEDDSGVRLLTPDGATVPGSRVK
jgi:methionyl-tRNA synthetase